MADSERDGISMPSAAPQQVSADDEDPRVQLLASRTWSASMPIRTSSRKTTSRTMSGTIGSSAPGPDNLFRQTLRRYGGSREGIELRGQEYASLSIKDQNDCSEDSNAGRNESLPRSGELRKCDDPHSTTCPAMFDLFRALYEDGKEWARIFSTYVVDPHAKFVEQWHKFFVVSCLVAVFVDPLFFFLMGVQLDNKCIIVNETMTTTLVVVRSVTDFIYFIHMLLQFKLAYIAPVSGADGAGDLIHHPKKIALNYLKGYFLIDLFVALPLPQIMALFVRSHLDGSSVANYGKTLLRVALYIPRLCRLLHMLAGYAPTGFIVESAWANFFMNLLTYVLFGHIFGSCWYLFGLQCLTVGSLSLLLMQFSA